MSGANQRSGRKDHDLTCVRFSCFEPGHADMSGANQRSGRKDSSLAVCKKYNGRWLKPSAVVSVRIDANYG